MPQDHWSKENDFHEGSEGPTKTIFAHETACMMRVATGKGTKIWHYTHILGGTKIGENCISVRML